MAIEAVIFDLDDTLTPDEANVIRSLRATCDAVAKQFWIDPVI